MMTQSNASTRLMLPTILYSRFRLNRVFCHAHFHKNILLKRSVPSRSVPLSSLLKRSVRRSLSTRSQSPLAFHNIGQTVQESIIIGAIINSVEIHKPRATLDQDGYTETSFFEHTREDLENVYKVSSVPGDSLPLVDQPKDHPRCDSKRVKF